MIFAEPRALAIAIFVCAFILYWIVGGAMLAIVALFHGGEVRKSRFGCLFTLLALGGAYGAMWTGMRTLAASAPGCLAQVRGLADALPALVQCAPQRVGSGAALWGLMVLAAGIILMTLTRKR